MGKEKYRAMQRKVATNRRAHYRAEVDVALDALRILQRRGFCMSDIAYIGGLAGTTVERWMRGDVRPTRTGIAKVFVVMSVTGTYKVGKTPAYRNRYPHPDRELLRAKAAPEIARIDARRKGK